MGKLRQTDMIANTFKKFSLSELLDLNYALNEEIDLRQEQGELDLPVVCQKHKQEQEHKTERLVYTKCGKPGCQCANGEKLHGPYRYQYWRESGRLRSRYLGKG